jgi:hypothetical protein
MAHDSRLVRHDEVIDDLKPSIPDWIKNLQRPATPCVVRAFGPLEGIRAVGTGQLIAQPYIGKKLAEFGAEVIHIERPGGDVFRFTAPQLTRGPRPHGCDEAEVTKNKLSMGLDLKQARGIELLMALWKISDVWMESSALGTLERNGITNELALAVNPSLVIVRVSTYGQYGKEDYLGRPGYDAIAQAYGGMINLTGDPAGPPQRAKTYTGRRGDFSNDAVDGPAATADYQHILYDPVGGAAEADERVDPDRPAGRARIAFGHAVEDRHALAAGEGRERRTRLGRAQRQ